MQSAALRGERSVDLKIESPYFPFNLGKLHIAAINGKSFLEIWHELCYFVHIMAL